MTTTSFAYRPDFLTTAAASFETTRDGGLHVTVDGDETSVLTSLTKQETVDLRDFLAEHIK
jgi:hypothetical protein